MPQTTVYFVTNRAAGAAGAALPDAFGPKMVAMDGPRLSTGVAFVANTSPDPATLEARTIFDINHVTQDVFDPGVEADILGSGKPLLFFVHGFANSFNDAITRAAFNREWFADAKIPEADCTVIAFTWPSAGKVIEGKTIIPGIATVLLTVLGFAADHTLRSPLASAYLDDQKAAQGSGRDLARTLDRLAPLIAKVRAQGRRAYLLVHSMGHVVLQRAFASWDNSGQSPGALFDEAVLAAGDADFDFAGQPPDWILSMPKLAKRTSVYHSKADRILLLSADVNGKVRLGETGPAGRDDPKRFAVPHYCFVDCAGAKDAEAAKGLDYTHQYYRRVASVRNHIAATFRGDARPHADKP